MGYSPWSRKELDMSEQQSVKEESISTSMKDSCRETFSRIPEANKQTTIKKTDDIEVEE